MKHRRSRWMEYLKMILIELAALAFLFLICRLLPARPLAEFRSSSQAYYDDHGRLLRLTLSADEKYRLWVGLSEINPSLIRATLLYEDRYFDYHLGFNLFSLMKAAYETYIERSRRMGGSTITMQLARILYDLPSNSLGSKIKQILCAVFLEARYSKSDILEAYLNLVPYGGNIEGVGTASLIYFGKQAKDLTLSESITLAVIPQNPVQRSAQEKIRDRARERLLTEYLAAYPQSTQDEDLLRRPVALQSTAQLPFLAPHLVDMLKSREAQKSHSITTTLSLTLQALVERRVRSYIEEKKSLGILNASVLLLDWRSMEVKAIVGSADYFNDGIAGQVNGILARRSPGSTLKPFIYALGLDQGLIHSQSLLKDMPASFGAYSPDNFDGKFAGPLPVEEALIRSRNIPAVAIAAKLSNPTFYSFLKNAGIARLQPEPFYGLSLVLGGMEVSMDELVALYAALANGGRLQPLHYQQDQRWETPNRVFSPEAAYVVLAMLAKNPRPNYPQSESGARRDPAVSWKTGTSYGFRDAWTLGVFGPFVMAVWVGNFDGRANPILVGGQAAAPLFFQLYDAIRAEVPELSDLQKAPPQLKRVEVCSVSGQLPGPFCKHNKLAWFIPGKSPIQTCSIHREVLIDPLTGLQSCTQDQVPVRREVYEFWPSDILNLYRQSGLPRLSPPPFKPGCFESNVASTGQKPQILSPRTGVIYTMRSSNHTNHTVSLEASVDATAQKVYWFANDQFLGTVSSGRSLDWTPDPGDFILRAIDDLGRSDSRWVSVAMLE